MSDEKIGGTHFCPVCQEEFDSAYIHVCPREKDAARTNTVLGQNELRVKVAELCGWKLVDLLHHPNGHKLLWMTPDGEQLQSGTPEALPDYPNDLNACHEFEKSLTPEQCFQYTAWLCRLVECANVDAGWRDLHAISRATAEQRCRAFVALHDAQEGTDAVGHGAPAQLPNPSSSSSVVTAEGEEWTVTDGETCGVLDGKGNPVPYMYCLARPIAESYRDAHNASIKRIVDKQGTDSLDKGGRA